MKNESLDFNTSQWYCSLILEWAQTLKNRQFDKDSGAVQGGIMDVPIRKRILVVDDEPDLRGLAVQFLQRKGYDVESDGTPRQAIERVVNKGERFDGIVTDMYMPEITGLDMLRILQAADVLPTAVVLTCGKLYSEPELAVQVQQEFGGAAIAKPFSPLEFLRVVAAQLSKAASSSNGGGGQ